MATKIYIAGKITGDPDYKAKFEAAAEAYKKKGYTVLYPSWMPVGMQPADYMRICFAMIDTADVVAFLPGYGPNHEEMDTHRNLRRQARRELRASHRP